MGHCLHAEPVKLQGELQHFTPARPSIRVLAMAGQIVLSRHRVEIANPSPCFSLSALLANVAAVGSAFVWRDWRPFLVVVSRVGVAEEVAGCQNN